MNLFEQILTTPEIIEEWNNFVNIPNMLVQKLTAANKDFAKYIIEKYGLHLGEATGISLCRQEKIPLFFTDDLDAKETTHFLGFEAHGTLAILLRSLREKILTKQQAIDLIEALYMQSSLFFTEELKEWTITEIKKFKD